MEFEVVEVRPNTWKVRCEGELLGIAFGSRADADAYVEVRTAPAVRAPDGSDLRTVWDGQWWDVERDGMPIGLVGGDRASAIAYVNSWTAAPVHADTGISYRVVMDELCRWGIELDGELLDVDFAVRADADEYIASRLSDTVVSPAGARYQVVMNGARDWDVERDGVPLELGLSSRAAADAYLGSAVDAPALYRIVDAAELYDIDDDRSAAVRVAQWTEGEWQTQSWLSFATAAAAEQWIREHSDPAWIQVRELRGEIAETIDAHAATLGRIRSITFGVGAGAGVLAIVLPMLGVDLGTWPLVGVFVIATVGGVVLESQAATTAKAARRWWRQAA